MGVLLKELSEDGCAGASGGRAARPTHDGRREVRTAAYLLIVLTAGAYLPSSLYPAYQHAFGFSDLTMTLIYAMFALVSAPALLLFGPAADALGSRTVLRASVLIAAVATGCFAIAQGPVWLLVGRAGQGLALGAATGAATALITTRASGKNRTRGSMLASMVFVAGTAVGPVAAGILAQYAPAPQVLPYLLHLFLLATAWHLVCALPAPNRPARRWKPERPRIPGGMRVPFAIAASSGFLAWTVAGLFLAVIPAILSRAAGIHNLAIIGAVLGTMLACSVLSQLLVARYDAQRVQLAGMCALFVSLTALAVTGGESMSVILLASMAAGAGHGLAYGGANAAIDAVAPAGERAAVTSALYMAFYLGTGAPAVAVGLLSIWHPLSTAVSWISVCAAILVPPIATAIIIRSGRPTRVRHGSRRSSELFAHAADVDAAVTELVDG